MAFKTSAVGFCTPQVLVRSVSSVFLKHIFQLLDLWLCSSTRLHRARPCDILSPSKCKPVSTPKMHSIGLHQKRMPRRLVFSVPSPSAFSIARVTASCLGGFLSVPLTSRLLKLPALVSVAATLEALSGGSSAQLSAVSVLQVGTCVWKRAFGCVWIRSLTGSSWHCICQASLPLVIRSSFKLWLVSSSLFPLIR